jgi:hypothetical protein
MDKCIVEDCELRRSPGRKGCVFHKQYDVNHEGKTVYLGTQGVKNDEGKLRYDLVPWKSLEPVVRVLMYGSDTYGDFNWREVPNGKRRYFSALLRHFLTWWGGEDTDPETGQPHLAHVIANALFLMEVKE